MKNNKMKFVALLCVFAMFATLLTGCGNTEESTADEASNSVSAEDSANEGEEEAESETKTETAASDLEYVELNWYLYHSSKANDEEAIQAALDEYFLEKLNCKVNMNFFTQADYYEKIGNSLLSGEQIDIFVMSHLLDYNSLATQGALYPLDELLDEYGTETKGLFADKVWDSLRIGEDSSIYMLPMLKDNCYINGFIYNTTLAEELGLDMSKLPKNNWQELDEEWLLEAMAARDEKYPEYAGMPLISNVPTDIVPFHFSLERFCNLLAVCNIPGQEADPSKGADEVFNLYETAAFREMCLKNQRLVESGLAPYDAQTYERSLKFEPSTLLNEAAWGYTYISEDMMSEEFDVALHVFDNVWTDASGFGNGSSIGANSVDPERSMMVLNLVATDPYLATLLRFGVEGTHWEYDADGNMQFTERNLDPENPGWIDWYGVHYGGNLTIVDGPESYVGPDGIMLQKIDEYNNSAALANHMGFVVNTDPIANELAACANVTAEYNYLILGQVESADAVNEKVDEMIAKLKANGVDTIVSEVQAQLDAWLASK